ncbi:SGNH/GDSL hydrolase family protein [Actinoplanes sp. NPDC023936]|uniref:SGNH/GDSL hydrolase family protein n=1 Tax=Actinoplanes sp. NPDC023936 TaxID=3154910 RepID=UPI0033DF0771
MRLRPLSRTVAVLVTAVALVLGTTAAARADTLDYVALGDSAAAGPLVGVPDWNLLCLRSRSQNYPRVVANLLGARLTDVTCSAAKLPDLSGRQYGIIAPQLTALRTTTDLVTLTVGGNDSELVSLALGCVNLLREPLGTSCADRQQQQGNPARARIAAFATALGSTLAEIHRRAPQATLVVTGYPTYIRPGGCFPAQPIWARDADYVQSLVADLNTAIEQEAREHQATYVDLAAISAGHDTCAPAAQRYVEGLVPASPAAPLHPNARGMAAFGHAIATAAR